MADIKKIATRVSYGNTLVELAQQGADNLVVFDADLAAATKTEIFRKEYPDRHFDHLFHAQELLAMQIASIHNLAFYLWLVGEARKHIIAGDFSTWKPMMVKRLSTRL